MKRRCGMLTAVLALTFVATAAQATSPQDWNTLFLSAPDFMRW